MRGTKNSRNFKKWYKSSAIYSDIVLESGGLIWCYVNVHVYCNLCKYVENGGRYAGIVPVLTAVSDEMYIAESRMH